MVSQDSGSLELLSWDLVMEVTPVNHDIPAGEQFSSIVEGFSSGGFWRSLLGRCWHLSVWAAPPVRAKVESRIPCQLWHVLMISIYYNLLQLFVYQYVSGQLDCMVWAPAHSGWGSGMLLLGASSRDLNWLEFGWGCAVLLTGNLLGSWVEF